MPKTAYPPLDIAAHWGRLNETIAGLVDYIPDDKLDWSPREELWNFRGILTHIVFVRHNWLGNTVEDGESFEDSDVFSSINTQVGIQRVLRDSWARVERFLSDQTALDGMYDRDGPDAPVSGHWIAFHLLEHDIHHRSDIFHYLALLEIEHPEIGTP